jgi:hypothetical protein
MPDRLIGLVVNARGGTAIAEWLPGTNYYNEIVEKAKQARLFGEITGVIWHQGESDSGRPETYLSQLEQLIEALRKDLEMPALPFVAGQLSEDKEERKDFNRMILGLPERIPHTGVVLSYGTATFDGTHFDSPSQVLLGERYADKMKSLIKGQ